MERKALSASSQLNIYTHYKQLYKIRDSKQNINKFVKYILHFFYFLFLLNILKYFDVNFKI